MMRQVSCDLEAQRREAADWGQQKRQARDLKVWKKKEAAMKFPPATWAGPFGTATPELERITSAVERSIGATATASAIAATTTMAAEARSSSSRKKAVLCCSGALERGCIVPILRHDGYEIVFLDPNQDGVDLINRQQSYTVREIDESGQVVRSVLINNYRALNMITQTTEIITEISAADIVVCYDELALMTCMKPLLIHAIHARKLGRYSPPVAIIRYWGIPCDQTWESASSNIWMQLFHEFSSDPDKAYVRLMSFVDRNLVRGQSAKSLDVKVEEYLDWTIGANTVSQYRAPLSLTKWSNNGYHSEQLKLLTTDLAFLITAYSAFHKDIIYIDQAIRNPEIERQVRQVLDRTVTVVMRKFHRGLNKEDYIQTLLKRIQTPCKMTCQEVARLPKWNITRCISHALRVFNEHGWDCKPMLTVFEQALGYRNVSDDLDSQQLGHWLEFLSADEIYKRLGFPLDSYSLGQKNEPVQARLETQCRMVIEKIKFQAAQEQVPLTFRDFDTPIVLAHGAVEVRPKVSDGKGLSVDNKKATDVRRSTSPSSSRDVATTSTEAQPRGTGQDAQRGSRGVTTPRGRVQPRGKSQDAQSSGSSEMATTKTTAQPRDKSRGTYSSSSNRDMTATRGTAQPRDKIRDAQSISSSDVVTTSKAAQPRGRGQDTQRSTQAEVTARTDVPSASATRGVSQEPK